MPSWTKLVDLIEIQCVFRMKHQQQKRQIEMCITNLKQQLHSMWDCTRRPNECSLVRFFFLVCFIQKQLAHHNQFTFVIVVRIWCIDVPRPLSRLSFRSSFHEIRCSLFFFATFVHLTTISSLNWFNRQINYTHACMQTYTMLPTNIDGIW